MIKNSQTDPVTFLFYAERVTANALSSTHVSSIRNPRRSKLRDNTTGNKRKTISESITARHGGNTVAASWLCNRLLLARPVGSVVPRSARTRNPDYGTASSSSGKASRGRRNAGKGWPDARKEDDARIRFARWSAPACIRVTRRYAHSCVNVAFVRDVNEPSRRDRG